MRLFSGSSGQEFNDGLDEALYSVPGTNVEITHADAVEATLITGAPGSGKSSAVGKYIAMAMLKKGYGLCILCAKPDERKNWENYIKKAGREGDMVVFNKTSGYSFNFLQYEMTRAGEGAGESINIANYLMGLNELSKNFQAGGMGNESERFWDQALRRLVIRTIALLKLAKMELTVDNMRRIVDDSFNEKDSIRHSQLKAAMRNETVDEKEKMALIEEYKRWLSSNFFLKAYHTANYRKDLSAEEEAEMGLVASYWMKTFAKLSDRTKSVVIESWNGLIEPFSGGILKSKFSGGLSEELRPEQTYTDNKIVIIDFPIKEFGIAGLYAVGLYKIMFQAAMERRAIEAEENPTVVGLYCDEYHNFLLPEHDALFMATARSSRTACVFITQNINNIIFSMGQHNAEARAKSLLGNIGLKYFCSNADTDTNEWAASMIGRDSVEIPNQTVKGGSVVSRSYSQELRYKVPPEEFTTLKTGRARNKFKVEAVVFKAGKVWDRDEENYALVEFDQRI